MKKNKLFSPNSSKGFTLLELLVVIGILAVLLAITIIAINPQRNFAQANNTQRRSDVTQILNAIHQYAAANQGSLPAGIGTSSAAISSTGADLCDLLVTEYLPALPTDPSIGDAITEAECSGVYDTGYTVVRSASDNRVTVTAPNAQLDATISAIR